MVRYILRFITVMGSHRDPRQISLGFALGMVLGFTPISSLHNLLVLLSILLFPVNLTAVILSWMVFSGLALAGDPLFHRLGLFLLADLRPLRWFPIPDSTTPLSWGAWSSLS